MLVRIPARTVMLGAGLALILTTTAGAFGDAGHRVIGRIAEMHLTNTRALQEVRGILRPGESLADASVWADTIRSATYEDEDTPRFRLAHPAHETYHYTNVPFQKDRYDPALPGAHFTDIVQMTRECIRVLRGSSQAFTRREALRLLAHFAGDIHQPLHVGNAFVSAEGPLRFVVPEGPVRWRSSLGGNALRYGPDGNFNLHSYWDSHAVNLVMRKEDPAAYAARLVKELGAPASWRTPGDPEGWPEAWATEALPLAREAYEGISVMEYLTPQAGGRTGHRWRIAQPAVYDALARQRVPVQLAKGGYRLAATLQAIWP